ncbi:hypothetical protein QBC40DRAFT_287048 [Triangularia verruculosa]|uniref:Rhodopsin domain-containing protein n=1 Tax=Triangularia verruculosa TaxID=2587418 RepID=A0AAN7APQ5_9PEZI|nr:hypothetical protein QBC40DRAFT_287048 [Triangularia verruculosa]
MVDRIHLPMVKRARDAMIAISILWVVFGFILAGRMFARHRGIGIGLDDILAVVAFCLTGCTIGFNAAVFDAGIGHDMIPESPLYLTLLHNLEFMMKITFIFTIVYVWALFCLKMSQLWFYLRAFSLQLKIWIYIVMAICVAWAIIFTFVLTFLCDPIEQQWTLQRIGRCMDQVLVLKCVIMTNILTDLMIIALPMWTVWKLQMRTAEKIVVAGCFAIGLACVVISLVRFVEMFVIDMAGNFTGTSMTTFMLCSIELMLAGICTNVPMLRPYYLRWRQKYKSSHASSGYADPSTLQGPKSGRATPLPPSVKDANYSAWIELDDDKDRDSESNHDDRSERKLTTAPRPDPEVGSPTEPSAIHVSTKWTITRD